MREMSELGLAGAADGVYRVMLRRVRWRVSELAAEIGLAEGRLREVVGQLRAEGFVVGSADDAGAVRAVEPRLALPLLAARRLKERPGTGRVPDPVAVERFVTWHERSTGGSGDRAAGLDEVAVLAERLVAGARHEVVFSVPAYVPDSYEFSTPLVEAARRRGAEVTVLWSDDCAVSAAVVAHARWLAERGCQPRSTAAPVTRAMVIDGTTALVVDADARLRVLHGRRAVEPGLRAVRAAWAAGRPVQDGPVAAGIEPRRRGEVVLQLLAEGLTDDAVAHRIGVSVRTVRNDVAFAMAGMDARSRFQAGVRAAQLGLL